MMKRVLCVRLPDWPRQRRGAALRELELSDREALQRQAAWCEQFSPSVGVDTIEPPDSLLLDVTGLAGLFHGEDALVDHVGREFGRRGFSTRLALADTLGAAWALAHDQGIENCKLKIENCKLQLPVIVPPGQTLAALASLPVERLRLSLGCVETLRELGLCQIGQLFSFSRDGLAARFAPELLLRLDQATGAVAEVIAACHPSPDVEAEMIFEHPTARREILKQALERQLEQIARQLSPRRQGVQELVCRLQGESGQISEITVGLYRPSAAPRHLAELIEMQWEAAHRKLAESLASLRVLVTVTAPLEYHQRELFDDPARQYDPRQAAILVDRLSSRLGRGSVVRARLLPEAQPELAWRYEAWVGGSKRRPLASPSKKRSSQRPAIFKAVQPPSAGSAGAAATCPWPLSRPLSLASRPLLLEAVSVVPHGPPLAFSFLGEQHRVERTWGPERIETGWWRGRSVRRDYYRVETAAGRWFWLFRQLTDGRWYFHGKFD
jgi:protein ImuB